MPIYEFTCLNCQKGYEVLTAHDPQGEYPGVTCPDCDSDSKKKLISVPVFNFANPVGTDRWNSDKAGHDYRYKFKAPGVAAERSAAASASHVGANPYNGLDDISSGNHFGAVE